MDLYDKKILKLLIENSRYKISDIAKAVGLSKDSIIYRIKKLEENKIITGYSVMVDPRNLGFNVNHILLKLKRFSGNKKEEIIEKLKNHNAITFISSQIGIYDLQVIFQSKDLYDKNKIVNEIINMFEDTINDYKLINHICDYNFSFLFSDVDVNIDIKDKNNSSFSKLLIENKEINCYEPKFSNYDNIDKIILKKLVKNPKEKLINIANQIQMSVEGVKNRIKSIIKKGAIYRFSLYPNHLKLDLFNYMLLFKIQNFNEKTKKTLNNYLKKSNFILYAGKFEGEYNLVIYILAKNPIEFQEKFEKLKIILEDFIINYDLSILTNVHKFVLLSKKFFEN